MRGLRFSIERGRVGGISTSAYLGRDEAPDLHEALVQEVVQSISTDLNITVGGVTMFLAAWEDPDHWSTDWAEKLDIDVDDVPAAVEELLVGAIESA